MRTMAIIGGVVLLAMALLGARGTQDTALGTATLAPVGTTGVDGSATFAAQGSQATLVTVQAEGMGNFAVDGAAVMSAGCGNIVAMLNPLEASGAGDGSSVSIVALPFDPTWWVGVLSDNTPDAAPVACGPARPAGSATPTETAAPASTPPTPATPTPDGGTTAPAHRQPTPVLPTGTPSPVGS